MPLVREPWRTSTLGAVVGAGVGRGLADGEGRGVPVGRGVAVGRGVLVGRGVAVGRADEVGGGLGAAVAGTGLPAVGAGEGLGSAGELGWAVPGLIELLAALGLGLPVGGLGDVVPEMSQAPASRTRTPRRARSRRGDRAGDVNRFDMADRSLQA